MNSNKIRWWLVGGGVLGLLATYTFQGTDVAGWLGIVEKSNRFMINRIIRYLLGDGMMLLVISGLFSERKYVVFAVWVQIAGTVFLLAPYLIMKRFVPGYNGPLISFLHRLIVNPTLLILLIPAFFYQRSLDIRKSPEEA